MFKRYLHISFGVLLVAIGLIGGLIPIFQGWIFGIPGLIILSKYFPKVNRLVSWAKRKAKSKKIFKKLWL
jgi:uncharacterized membrane protein YbaN (DUF454 family)